MDISFSIHTDVIILFLPLIFTFLFYLFTRLFNLHQWRSIHLTAQWSAPVLVAGVIYLIYELYDVFILSYVLISFILFLSVHLIIQWKRYLEVSLQKAIVLLLRIAFLLFFLAYLCFAILYAVRFFA